MSGRIVLDARSLIGARTGVGRYAAEIGRRLPAELPGVQLGFHKRWVSPRPPPAVERRSLASLLKRVPLARPAARSLTAAIAWWAVQADLYWAPNHALPAGVRCKRTVVTVHDLSWLLHPAWHPADRVALFLRRVPRSLARADVVVNVSQTVRDELIELLRVPPERIRVVPNGIDQQLFRPRSEAEAAPMLRRLRLDARPFVLAVGTIEPRKNLQALLVAWARLGKEKRREHDLVIAGGEGWQDAAIRSALSAAGPDVRALGRVSDEELASLYSRAAALVYPSVYEGFGLPPLEALATGTLPIVADIPVMREVVGDRGILYGRPDDSDALASALDMAVSRASPDDAVRAQRRASVSGFTWDRSAHAHAAIFSALL
jgi:glycosyltransferase involved in cell wall biosynthesis